MSFIVEAFFSGCISKVINDGKDYSWSKIKSVIKDRHDQNISTKICRVIEKSLNIVTDNAYKNSDKLYDAIEKIFNNFKTIIFTCIKKNWLLVNFCWEKEKIMIMNSIKQNFLYILFY